MRNNLDDLLRGMTRYFGKGSLTERLSKEIANSLYGQVARSVSGMSVNGRPIQTFDLKTGKHVARKAES